MRPARNASATISARDRTSKVDAISRASLIVCDSDGRRGDLLVVRRPDVPDDATSRSESAVPGLPLLPVVAWRSRAGDLGVEHRVTAVHGAIVRLTSASSTSLISSLGARVEALEDHIVLAVARQHHDRGPRRSAEHATAHLGPLDVLQLHVESMTCGRSVSAGARLRCRSAPRR